MATTTKLPTGTQIKGVTCPRTGRPLYIGSAMAAGGEFIRVRVGKAGTTGSRLMTRDDAVYTLQRLPKSERRLFRKALAKIGETALAAFDVRATA